MADPLNKPVVGAHPAGSPTNPDIARAVERVQEQRQPRSSASDEQKRTDNWMMSWGGEVAAAASGFLAPRLTALVGVTAIGAAAVEQTWPGTLPDSVNKHTGGDVNAFLDNYISSLGTAATATGARVFWNKVQRMKKDLRATRRTGKLMTRRQFLGLDRILDDRARHIPRYTPPVPRQTGFWSRLGKALGKGAKITGRVGKFFLRAGPVTAVGVPLALPDNAGMTVADEQAALASHEMRAMAEKYGSLWHSHPDAIAELRARGMIDDVGPYSTATGKDWFIRRGIQELRAVDGRDPRTGSSGYGLSPVPVVGGRRVSGRGSGTRQRRRTPSPETRNAGRRVGGTSDPFRRRFAGMARSAKPSRDPRVLARQASYGAGQGFQIVPAVAHNPSRNVSVAAAAPNRQPRPTPPAPRRRPSRAEREQTRELSRWMNTPAALARHHGMTVNVHIDGRKAAAEQRRTRG